MIQATSNERYRLKKLMKGNDGTTYPDALNEKTDDSIDAGSKVIKAKYEDGSLVSIYNNGRPMNDNDRLKYIQLDSEKSEESSDEEETSPEQKQPTDPCLRERARAFHFLHALSPLKLEIRKSLRERSAAHTHTSC